MNREEMLKQQRLWALERAINDLRFPNATGCMSPRQLTLSDGTIFVEVFTPPDADPNAIFIKNVRGVIE